MRTISDRSTQRCAPTGFSAVAVALSSGFSVSGSAPMSASPPASSRGCEAELLPVERRALEQVRELRAVGRVVERELLVPRTRLDLRLEHHSAARRLVRDGLLGLPGQEEAERVLLLLGEVREQARGAREDRNRLDGRHRSSRGRASPRRSGARRSSAAASPTPAATASRSEPRELHVGAAHAALVGELEDPLRARVDRAMHGMSEAGHPGAGSCALATTSATTSSGRSPPRRARSRPRAAARTPRTSRARPGRRRGCPPRRPLQRRRVRRERHPRGDVRRHHPVLGDRDEQEVEEEALVVGRLVAR